MNPVNGLEPCDQFDIQEETKVKDKIFWKSDGRWQQCVAS